MRVLALALGVPFPPAGGGLTRTFHLLQALSAAHDVELLAFTYGEPYAPPPYPVRVVPVPWQWSALYQQMTSADVVAARAASDHLSYAVDDPWFVSALDPTAMNGEVRAAVARHRPDVVLLEGTPLAQFMPCLPPGVPCLLDCFDVHSHMARRALATARPDERRALSREAARVLAFERRAVREAHACLVVSADDATAARAMLGAMRVHLVPNGVDTTHFAPANSAPEPGAILFTGRMNYEPNAEAVLHCAEQVLPLVRREVPHARLHVVGAAPPPAVAALRSDAVVVHGQVDDMRPYHARAEVVVVPVRRGGGTRLKVLEAAASGKAIVSTPLGVEGLPFVAGHDVLVADAPEDFAAAVVALLRDEARRHELGRRARQAALAFDWSAIGAALRAIVEQTAA